MTVMQDALAALQQCLEELRVPALAHNRPGMTRREIDAATSSLPIQPPEELVLFYEWCGAANRRMGYPLGAFDLAMAMYHVEPLDEAVSTYDITKNDPRLHPSWFPFMGNSFGDNLMIPCAPTREEAMTSPRRNQPQKTPWGSPAPSLERFIADEIAEADRLQSRAEALLPASGRPIIEFAHDDPDFPPLMRYVNLPTMLLTIVECFRRGAYFVVDGSYVDAEHELEREVSLQLNPGMDWPEL